MLLLLLLEIFLQAKNEIILRKYAPMGDMIDIANNYVETLYEETKFCACITDSENIIAISGVNKEDFVAKQISDEILQIMKERGFLGVLDSQIVPLILNEKNIKYTSQIIIPIIIDAEVLGCVILFSINDKKLTINEEKLVKTVVKLLVKQLD